MPIAAYSTVLWELSPGYGPPGPILSNPVPAGFVWVVRWVSAINEFSSQSLGVQQMMFQVDGYTTWATPRNGSRCQIPYESGDVRWVAEPGSFLSITSNSNGWRVRVSGYQIVA